MARVVYTQVESIEQFKTLKPGQWRNGDNDSYANTKRAAATDDGLQIIGRMATARLGDNSVQIQYARFGRGEWRTVCVSHVRIAEFFAAELAAHQMVDGVLREFITSVPDGISREIKLLIGLDAGYQPDYEKASSAANTLNAGLAALGIPTGDWTWAPMMREMGFSV